MRRRVKCIARSFRIAIVPLNINLLILPTLSVEYFDQLLSAACQVHVVYLAQLLGAVLFIRFISNHDIFLIVNLQTAARLLVKTDAKLRTGNIHTSAILLIRSNYKRYCSIHPFHSELRHSTK